MDSTADQQLNAGHPSPHHSTVDQTHPPEAPILAHSNMPTPPPYDPGQADIPTQTSHPLASVHQQTHSATDGDANSEIHSASEQQPYGRVTQTHEPPLQPDGHRLTERPPAGSIDSQPESELRNDFVPPLPPRRHATQFEDDDPFSPIHYTRDPHKLVAYLVPFPKPIVKGVETAGIPDRFLIYTPPPPPLTAPVEGQKEDKLHKVQRKWQEEVRAAKTSDAKTASWKGVKSKATKGISYVMSKTTSSSLDFVNRIPGTKAPTRDLSPDGHANDGVQETDATHKTVGLEEMTLVYPSSYHATPDQVRIEFVNTMMRTKSKAQRDAVLATGLLPVSAAIDILATIVWPFGGLLEVDGVWAYSSIRGAKTARSVTKRLTSSTSADTLQPASEEQEMTGDKLHLEFKQSPRLEVLQRYVAAKCAERDRHMFQRVGACPTETEVLNAIGWASSQDGSTSKNWEDEQWETEEVKADMRSTLGKAAKEWDKWCTAFAKDPEKALKK